MTGMGIHSKPVDGIPVANGHAPVSALAPFAVPPELQVRQGGPVAPWPQPAKPDKWRHVTSATRAVFAHRGWLAAIPVILVNAVAVVAQLTFLRSHLSWAPAGQVLVAVTLESVAVYLAWHAHLAIIADDSAMRLRLAAYGFAAIVGVMNYSHYRAPGWRPTFPALVFALCSVISPWLWAVHSRRQSRDALKAKGLIEPHAVRLGATRWTWHPLRSAKVMFRATWLGENDPAAAIALPAIKTSAVAEDVAVSVADDGRDEGQEPPPDVSESIPPEPVEPVASAVKTPAPSKPTSKRAPGRPSSGRAKAAAAIRKDGALTDEEVMKRTGVSESTVRRARADVKAETP